MFKEKKKTPFEHFSRRAKSQCRLARGGVESMHKASEVFFTMDGVSVCGLVVAGAEGL